MPIGRIRGPGARHETESSGRNPAHAEGENRTFVPTTRLDFLFVRWLRDAVTETGRDGICHSFPGRRTCSFSLCRAGRRLSPEELRREIRVRPMPPWKAAP